MTESFWTFSAPVDETSHMRVLTQCHHPSLIHATATFLGVVCRVDRTSRPQGIAGHRRTTPHRLCHSPLYDYSGLYIGPWSKIVVQVLCWLCEENYDRMIFIITRND